MKNLTIGLVGNPNTGKTTLFNQLTGARQRVGNWAGVTVERKEGQFFTAESDIRLVDLPGTRSLTTISSETSIDERIACQYLLDSSADLVVNVVDASNLESNLYLTLQVLELGVPCIVALNMTDIAESQAIDIDVPALSLQLGCPVIPMTSSKGQGISQLKNAIDQHQPNPLRAIIAYPQAILSEVKKLSAAVPNHFSPQKQHWLAVQMLEGDIYSREICQGAAALIPEAIENSANSSYYC